MAVATSFPATGFKGLCSSVHVGWATSLCGEDRIDLMAKQSPPLVRVGRPTRYRPMMRNVNEGKGVFAPLVILTRNIIGMKRFNQLRGKAIALHSQVSPTASLLGLQTEVITEFCKSIGADGKQRQGLIRLAKKNGEWLGFLA
ncbi:protein PROTON GRADIENT REGULATION 5, chloroplastic-like protein [Cinnamomum micranthum f. kanehirae]|uniref:Protein PROTON GRADIENT REGULATION 5, chloroplastic-like protein n=2 Tax=Magnoliopsida TaxID=3398 RepID=A0A3S3R7J6_9MAGN|nr:protein PROTON GRADIENT REGULATION 5, chloroplastic-like protein [Cinnamomum micranthum f. kanehirae]